MSNDTTSTAPVDTDETVEEKSDSWTISIKKPSLPRFHAPSPKTIAIAAASAVGGALVAVGTGMLASEDSNDSETEMAQIGLSNDELSAIASGVEVVTDIDSTSSDE